MSKGVKTEALSPFKYVPLPNHAHTRVLDLQPAIDPDTPLHASLRYVNLDSDLLFDAVSYTWGEPIFNEEIIIDQISSIKITANLRDGLVSFRLPTEVRRLWVDAICINQTDDHEKARQIPRMSQIYRGASSVLVWLGDSLEGSAHLRNIARLTQHLHSANRMKAANDLEIQEMQEALDGIVCLPWFSLAPGRRKGIIDLLADFSDAACSNPRDTIYAIAGLAEDVAFRDDQDDDEKVIIDINYTKDVEEVFSDFAFAVASNATHPNWKGNEGFGKLLRETITRADGSRLGGRCSWAPDWRLPKTRVPTRFEYDDLNLSVCSIPKPMLVLPDAYYMGSIKHIFKCFPEGASIPVAISWINELLEWAKEQVLTTELSTISSDEDTNMLLAQLFHIMTGGEARWTRLDQPLKVAEYVEEISKKMQGRLVFAMLPDTYPGHQEALRLELGIGPSHAHIGDIVCSAGVSPDDVRNRWGSS
ncbi:heterokaryon incompatibility protein-domain-containing protein [Annulohypoxylon nitens]|nr:heterokaryon incompatibility protein-domain-containing protein [Annulohypoxylon nitens]